MNDSSLEAVGAFHSALGSLNRLKLASPPEHQRLIGEAIEELKVMRSKGGVIIPSSCSDEVEAIQDRIFRLAREDKRLGGLFQVS